MAGEELKTVYVNNSLKIFSYKVDLGKRTVVQDSCDNNIMFCSFCTFCSRNMILNFNSGF